MNIPDQTDVDAAQALRLAQLEIKMLRQQLGKAMDDVQSARAEILKKSGPLAAATTAPATLPENTQRVDFNSPRNADSKGERRVLCVEDSEANFQLIEAILSDRPGTSLTWANSGKKGVELAYATGPELVLLDLDLPDMHGSEVMRQLRAQQETAQTPVIVISADATPSQIERMLAAGARDYITKPFEIRRFLLMFDEIFPQAAA